jgi:hypothetical protein
LIYEQSNSFCSTYLGVKSTAKTFVSINAPPAGGSFVAFPDTGVALTTTFNMIAQGWTDEDLPVTICFGYLDERQIKTF